MKIKELKSKNDKELKTTLDGAFSDLQVLRFKVASRQHKDVREIREKKKLIARILTLQKQRQVLGVKTNIEEPKKK